MFPEWERWIVPKPTFLAEQLLKEAATLEARGEQKNRVKRHNIFEHYKDGFQPHELPAKKSKETTGELGDYNDRNCHYNGMSSCV